MATLDSSPSPFPEQTWTHWVKRVEGDCKEEADADGWPNNTDDGSGTMKLRKEDMSLYGLCPSRDEFYLVVCERCGQVIKPQALKKHVELRHKERSPPTVTKSCRVDIKRTVTKSDTRSLSSASLSHLGQSSTASSHSIATLDVAGRTVKHSKSAAQLCTPHPGPPTELAAVLAMAPGGSTSSSRSNHHHTVHHHHKSGRKNHSLAFVKVERMPSPKTLSVLNSATTTTSGSSKGMAAPVSSGTLGDSQSKHGHSSSSRHSETAAKPLTSSRVKIEPRSDVKQTSTPGGSSVPVKVESRCASTTTMKESVVTTTVATTMSSATTTCMTTLSVMTTTLPGNSCRRPPKERKFLPCKDREFDPDKHCGVWIPELARPCTRSLTCKTHALSLRRAVQARSKSFDELLREHRAAKEALLKAKAAMAAGSKTPVSIAIPAAVSASSLPNSSSDHQHRMTSSPLTSPDVKHVLKPAPHKLLPGALSPRSAVVSHVPRDEPVQLPAETYNRLSSDGEDNDLDDSSGGEKPDYPYVNSHPRPAAVNGFGSWLQGSGCYVFNRKEDLMKAAFLAAVNRHLHPPPHKRLCVESKLPQGSNITASSNDPYEFTFADHHTWLGGSAKVNSGGTTPIGVAGHSKPLINKQKVKASSSVPLVNSPGSNTASLRTPVTLVVGNRTNVAADVVPSSVRTSHSSSKRKRSGVVLSHASNVIGANSAPSVSQLNLSAVSTSHMNNPISIAIPVGAVNVNLGSATIGDLGMSSVATKHQNFARNNLFKDLNIVVTNIDGSGLVNGHLVTIPGIQLAAESVAVTTHNHVPTANSSLEKANAKAVQPGRVVGSRTLTLKQSQQVLMPDGSANSLNAIVNAMSVGGAVVMDTAPPPGTVVTPSSMQMAFTYGNTGVAPSTTPSPLIRSGSASPQISAVSPLPNGVISSSQAVTVKAFPTTQTVTTATVGAAEQVAAAVLEQQQQLQQLQQLPQQQLSVRAGQHCKSSGKNGERRGLQLKGATAAMMANKNSVHAQLAVGLSSPTTLIATSNLQQVFAAPVVVPTAALPIPCCSAGHTIATATSKMPMQPMSFTIMAPPGVSGLVTQSQPGSATLVLEGDARRTSVEFQDKMVGSPNVIS